MQTSVAKDVRGGMERPEKYGLFCADCVNDIEDSWLREGWETDAWEIYPQGYCDVNGCEEAATYHLEAFKEDDECLSL